AINQAGVHAVIMNVLLTRAHRSPDALFDYLHQVSTRSEAIEWKTRVESKDYPRFSMNLTNCDTEGAWRHLESS
ncbi:4724_t:CDS:1, partial [Acaulospora colombiana]